MSSGEVKKTLQNIHQTVQISGFNVTILYSTYKKCLVKKIRNYFRLNLFEKGSFSKK